MPYFGGAATETPDIVSQATFSKAAPNQSDQQFASQYKSGLEDRSPGSAIAATAIGSVLDTVDTVGSSLIPGVNRQDINNKFLGAVGTPGFQGWFEQNRGAVEVGSGIIGAIGADYIAGKVLKPTSMAMQFLREVPVVGKVASLDAQYERAKRIAQLAQTEVAARGAMGVDRFIGGQMAMNVLGVKVNQSVGKSTANLFAAAAVKGLARNVTTEAIMASTLHTNDFLYSDSLTHNLAWSAGGLAVGGVLDSMVTAYGLRKFANSDTIRQVNRQAFDVSGLETSRLHAFDTTNTILKAAGMDSADLGFMFHGSGAVTDQVTSLAIQAAENVKERGVTERAKALFSKREAFSTPTSDLAFQTVNKATTRGIRGVKNTGFHVEAEGFTSMKEALTRNPMHMFGIEEVGTIGADMTHLETDTLRRQTITSRLNNVQSILNDGGTWKNIKNKDGTFTSTLTPLKPEAEAALRSEANELRFSNSFVPKVMLEPGEWAPLSHAAVVEGFTPRKIVTEGGLGEDNLAVWQAAPEEGKPRLGMNSDGDLFLPDGKNINNLDHNHLLQMYQIGRQAANHFIKTGEAFTLPANPTWFHLDLAEQIAKNSDNPAAVNWTGKMTRETAAVESFAQKVDAVRAAEKGQRNLRLKGVTAPLEEGDIYRLKVMFNLPRVDSYTQGLLSTSETPVDLFLGGLKNGDQVRNMSHSEILDNLNTTRKITGLTDETVDSVKDLHGNSFNFMMDRDGKALKPIVGYQRPMNPYEWGRDDLFIRQAMKEANLQQTVMGPTSDPITKELFTILSSDPSSVLARNVMELADDQGRSFVPGFRHAAPQTTAGSLINAVTSRARRDVDSPGMRAASNQQELKTRAMQAIVKEVFDKGMAGTITEITSQRNARSKMLLDQVLSFGHGWDFADKLHPTTLPNGEGAFGFVLDHNSVANQKRFQEAFGSPLTEGQLLLNPDSKPIVMDELAKDTFTRMQDVHGVTLDAKNTLLRSQGLGQIAKKNWYMPPPNLKGKYVGFTFDLENNVVPGMTVVADSPERLNAMKLDLAKSDQWKDSYRFRTRDDVTDFMTLWDKAQMDFLAPNTTAIQPKKSSFGRTGGNQMNTNAFSEALFTMRDSLLKHGDDVMGVMYDDVLKAAKVRAKLGRVQSAVGADSAQHSSVYDRFVQNLTGQNSLGAKDSFFGDAYGWLEGRINGLLKTPAALKPAVAAQTLNDWIRAAIPGKSSTGEQFNQFATELGQYMPFKSVSEMKDINAKGLVPPEVAGITSKLSQFEAGSRLRWFESMHAVVNVGSIVANMPAVIRALQPREGETLAEAGLRNSSLAMTMNLPDSGKGIVVPHTHKLLWSSMNDLWSKTRDADLQAFDAHAIRLGYMGQEVAELNRAWGAIDSKAGWRGFMFGDEGRQASELSGPLKGARAKIASTGGLDKWLGVISDKSEDMTRQWGMYAGRRVAKAMGIDDVESQVNFAHEITNKLIANYDPRNRPEIFQGALGAPLGLFQSYAFNQYERLFRYLETENTGGGLVSALNPLKRNGTHSAAVQMAMQSAIFGTASVPGWSALNWAFFDHGQAKGDDPVKSMYQRFGPDADWIMHGTLSNLPKLFGGEGVNLYTRGDASVRTPGLGPIVDTISRVAGGFTQAIQAVQADGPNIGLNHLAEIASNVITNRPIAGMIEQFGAHGDDTSFDGQLVADTKTVSQGVYRALGVRSMAQQKQIDAFYASKTAQEEQAARKDVLSTATRAAIRDKRFDDVPRLFEKYVSEGGDPRHYSRWLKDSFTKALDTRAERELDKAMKDPTNRSNATIARLLDGQVDVDEDDQNTDDYGREQQISNMISQSWEATPPPNATPSEQFPIGQ